MQPVFVITPWLIPIFRLILKLGLSATRLPPDGRVPIFRVGDIGVIASSKLQQLPSHVQVKPTTLNDQRISWCELEDSNGVKVHLICMC
jgi:hypothetical protein